MPKSPDGRILIVDDNKKIHQDYAKILVKKAAGEEFANLQAAFLGTAPVDETTLANYQIDNAFQGQEGLQLVKRSVQDSNPYDLAFVDMRMPPGWDGVETIKRLWDVDSDLQVVICTAFSDYTWEEIVSKLGRNDQLLILKKPFDNVEVSQLASAMVKKRKLASLASAKLNQLEEMVEERTVKLERARKSAEIARRSAVQASVAKSEFLANMSHEIRTPLTAILGYADNFLSGESATNLTEQQTQAVDTIARSGQHLLQLINGILDLSKIESGCITLESIWCDPKTIASEVVETMVVQARMKEIELEFNVTQDFPKQIQSDPVRIKQILLNLIGNAIKFTSEGKVSLNLSAKLNGRRAIRFEVTDTGIGIPQDKLDDVFSAFTQADGSTTRNFGGTGLGLTVSKRLANKMGGDIELTSELGSGSTFALEIPFEGTRDFDAPNQPRSAPHPKATKQRDELEGIRILLAEDDRLNQHLIKSILNKGHATVDTADDGIQAYEKTTEAWKSGKPFDVVLLDMQMPGMDGYTVAGKLRSDGYEHPIIALTAHAMENDRRKCIDAGCTDYASKPIEREKLFGLIQSLAP